MYSSMIQKGALLTKVLPAHQVALNARCLSVVNGDLSLLAPKVKAYIEENAAVYQPDTVYVCDGSDRENIHLLGLMEKTGVLKAFSKYENCWLARTDPADVARVESKTVISTTNRHDTVPVTKEGVKGVLGNWISPSDLDNALNGRFPGCMKGRTMYVIPFSMGPVGSPLSKIGIELTDSAYVAANMRIMTRMGQSVLDTLATGDFVQCVHSVGQPLPASRPEVNSWPCNPEKTIIAHLPEKNLIASFGSGYGGNSLMGKKCFALRMGSILARDEGWLAEHMLILGITNPLGHKHYIAAAFPSACGKTNLAMMNPSLPGYKIECVGDDICWMKFDDNGDLRAINPEAGFFGVAPGTSMETNPNALVTTQRNTIFTNVAETSDGGFYWEGLEKEVDTSKVEVTSWLGEKWTPDCGKPAAHPNSRFCTPASQCPIIDPDWESPRGVKIDAILFGGRRPQGVPLVYEAFNWRHGVFLGAAMRSEATAAAEHKGKAIMHDPFAMRPFFGYNFGNYLKHWLSMEQRPNAKLPKIYHINWFRKSDEGCFLWPGFGENIRVLDWICRRIEGKESARESAIGYVPTDGALNTDGLKDAVDMKQLFALPKDFWQQEVKSIGKYFKEQLPQDLPDEVANQLTELEERVRKMN